MKSASVVSKRSILFAVSCGAIALLLLCPTPRAEAADCIEMMPGTLFDTSDSCSSQPEIDRVFGSTLMTWGGVQYMLTNNGNDLLLFDTQDSLNPVELAESRFRVGNVGDSVYDLQNLSVCDDCRYGVASYKKGLVLMDFGDGAAPAFVAHEIYDDANNVPGAFTFVHDEQQYLIASNMINQCATNDSALYTFDGIEQTTDLGFIGCVDAPGGQWTQIVGGFHVGDYLYLGDVTQRVYLHEITGTGSAVSLTWKATPMVAYMIRDKGLAMDLDDGIAVEANSYGMKLWDLADPGNPVEMGSVDGDFNRATVAYPFVMVAKKGYRNSEQTFDISNLAQPLALDEYFWSPEREWNYGDHACAEIQGATLSPDGSALYLSRFSVMQVAAMGGCTEAPEADFSWIPNPAAANVETKFHDASLHGPTTWLWDFGDGGTSTERNPVHTFGAAGTYTVSLNVSNFYGNSAVDKDVLVEEQPVPPLETLVFVPAAAALEGANGSFWSTDVEVNNPSSMPMNYSVFLLERDADNSSAMAVGPFQLGPGKSVRYSNIVTDLFAHEGAGALSFLFDGEVEPMLNSRTFNTYDDGTLAGTFGQGIPGVAMDGLIPADEKVRLVQLTQNDDFRSNLGFLNGTGGAITVHVEFFLADGTSLGTDTAMLPPYGAAQWNNAFIRLTRDAIDDGYVDVWCEDAGGLFTVYGSVVGNDDFNDPTTVLPQ